MFYKIGTLAKRFGITTQAIRFYEKQGLLVSQYEDSTTRRYHIRNLKWLSSIRRYHEMGFGMKEIQKLFLCETPEAIKAQMDMHEEKLLAEIRERERMLAAVHRQKDDIERIERMLHTCILEPSPILWLLIDQEGQHLDEAEEIKDVWENWIRELAFVYSAIIVDPEAIVTNSELSGRRSGYCVDESIALKLNLKRNDRVKRFDHPLCIHTITQKAKGNKGNELHYILDYMNAHGLAFDGDAVGRCLCKVGEVNCQDDQVIPSAIYYEYWIPVKKVKIKDNLFLNLKLFCMV